MKQYEAVILAMQQSGGYATLGQLYNIVPKIPDCHWATKTPFASIRRIVQTHDEFFKVRPGLWALTSEKEKVQKIFTKEAGSVKEKDYSHYYYQGLVVEIGNYKGLQTYVPSQDKNKPFAQSKLGEITSVQNYPEFTYGAAIRQAQTIDVTWFNSRKFPHSFFEIEHSTDISHSLVKFVEFQDFRSNFYIVADPLRQKEFESKIALQAFTPIKTMVKFWDYDHVVDLHTKISASALAEQAFLGSGHRNS